MANDNIAFPIVDTASMRRSYSGADNVAIGYEAGFNIVGDLGVPMGDGWGYDDEPPSSFWHCAYCGQSNAADREGCRGCKAPRPEVM